MYQVAIYNRSQHEQHSTTTDRIAIFKSANDAQRWQIVCGSRSDADLPLALEFQRDQHGWELATAGSIGPVWLADGCSLDLSVDNVLPPDCLLRVGSTWFQLRSSAEQPELVPLRASEASAGCELQEDPPLRPAAATVTRWLAEVGQLHRAAAGSREFYSDAARFAVETVGLDAAWVLSRDNGRWHIAGSLISQPELGVGYDVNVLEYLQRESTTWFQSAGPDASDGNASEAVRQATVVSPVVDQENQLVGAVVGLRHTQQANRRCGIRPLEARMMHLLGQSVAIGIARLEKDKQVARDRVLLEQAFSPGLASYLQRHPEALSGQMREVTLLFADLRGYTRLAESLSPPDCCRLQSAVMEALTQEVLQQHGVVVDYFGDGLLALWNAPLDQADHADLACSAALGMLDSIDRVSRDWRGLLEHPLRLGVGVHTGEVHVGNAGTRRRLKYGPRGKAVHVASRVEAATKQLDAPLLVTSSTQKKLSQQFVSLRVCTAQLPGLEEPTELVAVYRAGEAAALGHRLDQYATALQLFEQGALDAAEQLLEKLLLAGPAIPARFLADRTGRRKQSESGSRVSDQPTVANGSVIEFAGK